MTFSHAKDNGLLSRFSILAGLLLIAFSFVTAKRDVSTGRSALPAVSNATHSGVANTLFKTIETIRVGERVVTDISADQLKKALAAPHGAPAWWDKVEIDPDQWRQIDLHMPGANGDEFDIVLLRPLRWLDETQAIVGGFIHLSLPEQGIDGLAEVASIQRCPQIPSGRGRVVTGTITHVRGGILNLHLSGDKEPLGVTENHAVYSVDRQAFVAAASLVEGEYLRGREGDVRIMRIESVQGVKRVFNLEVKGEHVFRVSRLACLVHNTSPLPWIADGSWHPPFGATTYYHYYDVAQVPHHMFDHGFDRYGFVTDTPYLNAPTAHQMGLGSPPTHVRPVADPPGSNSFSGPNTIPNSSQAEWEATKPIPSGYVGPPKPIPVASP